MPCLIKSNCILNEVKFIYCNLINYVFNYDAAVAPRDQKMLDMRNCEFICNNLFGTNFDYCNLENCNFGARVNCIEQINWLGNIFYNIIDPTTTPTKRGPLGKLISSIYTKEIIRSFILSMIGFKDSMRFFQTSSPNIYAINNSHYKEYSKILFEAEIINNDQIYTDGLDFVSRNNIKPWNYIQVDDGSIMYFVPPTSFKKAIIKTCNFHSVEGFQSFDFTQLAINTDDNKSINHFGSFHE